MRFPRSAAVALALVVAACGVSNRDVIATYKPKMDELRVKLVAAAHNLPTLGTLQTAAVAPADPLPVYDGHNLPAANTAFLPVERIHEGSEPGYDLIVSSHLGYTLAWTGPNNPMAESALDATGTDLSTQFDAALATTYVVLYRTVSYQKPVAADETTFDGGTLDLEAGLYRIDTGATIATCRIQATSAEKVSYSHKEGDDPRAALESFADSTLRDDALAKLSACFKETAKAEFKLD
ncbi:hypothetical protein sos41_35880 [Alphaproteobacteria bacterium SO-S41]|nr:hypothetical protein sos41_35880 [Alphaproteobacteria bacterium SO-S41]